MQIKLNEGLNVGNETIYYLSLRQLTTADLMDAELASESPIATPAGILLLSSPSKMGYELLRRSVCKVGDLDRTLSMKELRLLSETDFNLLRQSYSTLNNANREAGMSAEGREAAAGS